MRVKLNLESMMLANLTRLVEHICIILQLMVVRQRLVRLGNLTLGARSLITLLRVMMIFQLLWRDWFPNGGV
ncbi:MAG: hypothetical protein CMN86_11720 [Stappia sp.]|nr:hypothetical protein [Stappia sp.]